MKALPLILTGLVLVSGAAVAADDYSKTIERPDGTLIVNWGQPPPPPTPRRPKVFAFPSSTCAAPKPRTTPTCMTTAASWDASRPARPRSVIPSQSCQAA